MSSVQQVLTPEQTVSLLSANKLLSIHQSTTKKTSTSNLSKRYNLNACVKVLINASLILLILCVDYIEMVTGMMTDEQRVVLQDNVISDGMAARQF